MTVLATNQCGAIPRIMSTSIARCTHEGVPVVASLLRQRRERLDVDDGIRFA